jgi:hypothetical protein
MRQERREGEGGMRIWMALYGVGGLLFIARGWRLWVGKASDGKEKKAPMIDLFAACNVAARHAAV